MNETEWSRLRKGWKQLYHSADFSGCRNGEKADDVLLHWMVDIYTYWQWKYNWSSRVMSIRCSARTLAGLFSPLHEASLQNAAERIDRRFF